MEHRNGTTETKLAPMQKTRCSLGPLRELLAAAHRRYLAFLSELAASSGGVRTAECLAEAVREHDRPFRGFNLFAAADLADLSAA